MYPNSTATQTPSIPAVVCGFVINTMNACEFEQSTGWGAKKAATVRTGPSMRPEPTSVAPGMYGCPMNAARREGTIWESPAGWVN